MSLLVDSWRMGMVNIDEISGKPQMFASSKKPRKTTRRTPRSPGCRQSWVRGHTLKVPVLLLTLCALVACGSGVNGPFEVSSYRPPSSNTPPTVDAGPDQNVFSGDNVTLLGHAHDDQWVNRAEWLQNLGPNVGFSGGTYYRPNFVAPSVSEPTELRFVLRAFDNQGQVGSDETSVFVEPLAQPPPEIPPGVYTLNFDSLPSDQGWMHLGTPLLEDEAFSVDGTRLAQTTVGSGVDSFARYLREDIASPNMRMTLSITARVLDYEDRTEGDSLINSGFGFIFFVSDGPFVHRLRLTDSLLSVGDKSFSLDTTVFRDYVFELHPGGGFDLYVDGDFFATGVGSESVHGNKIFFGDATYYENADAEIKAMSFSVGVNQVEMDINPSSNLNSVDPNSKEIIPVAILTTDSFDAVQVDWETVRFGINEATEPHGLSHVEDVDNDGDADLVLHFNMRKIGLACGDSTATLSGETFGGEPVTASDVVRTENCP